MTHAAKVRHALQKLAISTRYAKEAEAALRKLLAEQPVKGKA
jgi:hypothetical protein